ncbi:MAG TPA: DUF3667 domain-containing protein, partial [Longimicrobium sp.]|nr:DUF3667 domain-containing protein [Longimicrobium sp.]
MSIPAPPAHSSPAPAAPPTGACANCRAELHDRFCGRCGQDSRDDALTFRRFVTDSLVDVLNMDGRIARTMRALVKPGALTQAYLAGQRISFVPPFRLAFSCTLLLLLVVAFRLPRSAVITGSTGIVDDVGAVAGHQAAPLALLMLALLPALAAVVRWACGGRDARYLSAVILLLHEHALGALA